MSYHFWRTIKTHVFFVSSYAYSQCRAGHLQQLLPCVLSWSSAGAEEDQAVSAGPRPSCHGAGRYGYGWGLTDLLPTCRAQESIRAGRAPPGACTQLCCWPRTYLLSESPCGAGEPSRDWVVVAGSATAVSPGDSLYRNCCALPQG